MTHSLLFDGSLELVGSSAIAPDGYWFETLAGTSWGEAQPVEVAINSLLRDGALTQTERDDNREVNVLVKVRAVDGRALTEGTAVLSCATRKRTTLAWTPPDGYAPTRVFEVETSSLHSPDDFDDLAWVRNEQVFRVRLVCLPYWRGSDLITEIAEAIPSVGTVIDDGSSTTGWTTPTATISPAPSAMVASTSGRIAVQPYRGKAGVFGSSGEGLYSYLYSAKRTLSQAVSAGAYVSFEAELESPYSYVYSADPDGGTQIKSVIITSPEFGTQSISMSSMILESVASRVVRYTFQVPSALTMTSIAWTATQYRPTSDASPPYPYLYLDKLAVANTASLGKNVLKTIDVDGSARTTGAIHVAAPSDLVALGTVLAFTVPRATVAPGFRPDVRQWVAGGATTAAVGGKSGVFTGVTSAYGAAGSPVFNVPASLLRSGPYTIAASLYRTTTDLNFTVEASLLIGSTVVATQELPVQVTVVASTWEVRVLGTMYLPPVGVSSPTSAATVRFRFKGTAAPSIEELWAMPVDGDLTILDCGTGTVGPTISSHLWIDAPSPEQPQGGYWRGTEPTRKDAVAAWSVATVPGIHAFAPGEMLAYVASSSATGPTVSFDYYDRYQ